MDEQYRIIFTDDDSAEKLAASFGVVANSTEAANKKVLDLGVSASKMTSALNAAAQGSKRYAEMVQNAGSDTKRMEEALSKVQSAASKSPRMMQAFAKDMSAGLLESTNNAKKFHQQVVTSADGIMNIVRAEKLLNVSLADSTKAFDRESSALKNMLASYKEKSKSSKDLQGLNESLIAQANRFSEAERRLAGDLDRVGSVVTKLKGAPDASGMDSGGEWAGYIKSVDNALITSKDLEGVTSMLRQQINMLQKELGEPGTDTYAEKMANVAQFQEALNTSIKKTIALRKQEGLSGRASSKANPDTVAGLANLRRLGVISPQIAQMSYVMDLVTSAGMAASVAAIGVGTAIALVGKNSIKTAAELQQYNVTLQSLSTHGWEAYDKTMLGSRALGQAVNAEMLAYASKSIYSFDKIAEGTEKLVGYGIDMRLVNQEMEMLGNLALGDSKRLENLSIAYGQVYGQGKARAQEMYQFVNAGIPIFELLARKLNISTSAVMDMTRNGEVGFKLIRDLLKDLTSEGGKYADLMKNISTMSANGQWNMFLNNMKLTMNDIGTTLLPAVTDLLREVNSTMESYRRQKGLSDVTKELKNAPYLTKSAQMAITGSMADTDLNVALAKKEAYDEFVKNYGDLSGAASKRFVRNTAGTLSTASNLIPGAPGGAALAASTAINFFTNQKAFTPLLTALESFNKDILLLSKSTQGKSETERAGMFKGALSDNIASLRTMGVEDKTITSYLIETLFVGLNESAKKELSNYSPEQLLERGVPTKGSADVANAVGLMIKNNVGGLLSDMTDSMIDQFLELSKYDMDPEVYAALKEEQERRKRERKGANESLVGGAGDGDKGSKYKLDKYIASKLREKAVIGELVPLYQEYAEIHQLYLEDIKAGMGAEEAKNKEDAAKALYRQVDALNKINEAYADIYGSVYGKKQPMSSKEVDDVFAALDKELAGNKDITEREKEYKNSKEFRSVTRDALMSGTTVAEAHEVVKKLNAAFGKAASDSADAVSVAIRNYSNIVAIYQDVGVLTEAQSATVKEWVDLFGPDVSVQILTALGAYRDGLTSEGASALATLEAYKLLNAERGSGSVRGMDMGFKRARASSISATNTLSGELGFLDTSTLSQFTASPSDYGMADSGMLDKGYKMGLIKKFFADTSIYGDPTENYNRYSEELVKYQEAQSSLDKMKSEPLVDPLAVEDQQAKVDGLAASVKKLGENLKNSATSSKLLGDTWSQLKNSGVQALTSTLNESFYQLGATIGKGGRSFEDYQQKVAAIAEQMASSIPTILLQAAMSAFMTPGMFFVGLGLLAAAGVSGVVNGAMGVGQESSESVTSEQDVISNLQEQLQTMMDQFRDMMAYLDIARNNYIASEQAAQIAGYAKGDVFPGTTGLAQGVYTSPTFFRFANGAQFNGVMGEAGAEAIMPLTRGADGRLGVTAAGAQKPVQIVIENYGDATEVSGMKETTAADGAKQVTLVMERVVASMVASGKLDNQLKGRYGLTTPSIRRTN